MTTTDIVAKLWNLCNILKDDGVTYHQYVTELTYLLFLKMARETGVETDIPAGYRWVDLEAKAAPERLAHYKYTLIHLGTEGSRLVQEIRADLMDKCNLHTILRLPTGIFYAQGVKTNVLFFTRGHSDKGNTKAVWIYDLRANMPQYGKRTVLTREHFAEFEAAFGSNPFGDASALAQRQDTGELGRFRQYTRATIAERGDSLDISWLKDDSPGANDELPEPAVLAREVMAELEGAFAELRGILEELREDVDLDEAIA